MSSSAAEQPPTLGAYSGVDPDERPNLELAKDPPPDDPEKTAEPLYPIEWPRFESELLRQSSKSYKAGHLCRTTLAVMVEDFGGDSTLIPPVEEISHQYYGLAEYMHANIHGTNSFGRATAKAQQSNDVEVCLAVIDDWLNETENPLNKILDRVRVRLQTKSAQFDRAEIMAKLFVTDHSDVRFEEPTLMQRIRREAARINHIQSGGYGNDNFN